MSENAIEARGLTKRYGRKHAVSDLSFDVPFGRITGFLGPNGSGKTTTLRMLAGLIRPTAGRCTVLAGPVPGPTLRDVGTMIEEPSFYPYMSGRKNLIHAALLHGGVPASRIGEVLDFVHMDQAADKKVGAYSQGMRQRLGLARAMLWQPKVMLLDEPTNGLDPVGIAEIREALRAIAAQGVTILISSHILAELEKLANSVLVVERGRLLYDGTLSTLLNQLQGALVTYRLRSDDAHSLEETLRDMNLEFSRLDGDVLRVLVPQDGAGDLIGTLSARGIRLSEANREHDSLEDAYLRLLREDGRPV